MVRSAQTVVRLPGPLGGFSEHVHPDEIGPTNCQDCENVLALPGRLKKRGGIRQLTTEAHLVDARVEGIWAGLTNPSSPTAPTEVIFAKVATEADYDVGALWHLKSGSWTQTTGSPTITGKSSIFVPIGLSLQSSQRALVLADGSARAWRVELASTPRVRHCGIKPATASLVQTAIAGSITTAAAGTPGNVRFYLSFADEEQRPPNAPTNHPGLESNTWDYGSAVTLPTLGGVRLEFDDPPDGEHWTHVRVYGIKISSPYGQTRAYYMGSWYRPGYQKNTPNEIGAVVVTGDHYKIELTQNSEIAQASGDGAYDYKPTRNYVPENMRYFAFWDGRGFWARDYEAIVYHGDIFNPLGGGHPESLSGDFLPPVDGPVSLLADYGDALIVGIDRGIYTVTGTLSSYTNSAAARLEALPPHSAVITRSPGDLGPVAYGTGSYVVADGLLYFITRNGLARYEGPNVRPQLVGLAVQSELPNDPSSTALRNSVLAHDPVKHIIYLLVREDVSGGKYSGDSAGTSGQVQSYVYAYSYREIDRRTGFGKWTRFGRIGVTTAFNGNDRRYSMIGMRHAPGGPPRLIVGARCVQETTGDVNDCDLYGESSTSLADQDCEEEGSIADADISFLWESGNWDLGLPERRKWIHSLTVKLRDNNGATNSLSVAESLDGAAYQTQATKEDKARLEKRIGGLAEQISVKFSGTSQVDTEIFNYSVDAEPSDVA